jgi:DNA polymerase I-like protein with 3'-5' exonuclease and polymerase domains
MPNIIICDAETFWSQDYTLSKLTPIEYCYGEQFELQSMATKINDEETIVTFGWDETKKLFDTIDWSKSILVGHNLSEFDSLILAGHGRDHFGLNPKLWACTLAMARPIHAKTAGGSLKALAEHYGLQAKGSLEATNTKGLRLADFTPEMRRSMAEYNKLDTDITYELFKILLKHTPADELRLIDATIRMLVEPRFEADVDLLQRGLKAERKRKERLLVHLSDKLEIAHDAEQVRKTCASAAKFKALLESLGVEVPTKISPTTGKEIPALAKTDQAMKELQEHPDEVVQAAAEARLGVRSTILETRMERLITMAGHFEGRMPIPLRYYGADTTGRFSGTMSVNLQNLPRVNPKKAQISDVLRHCLRAPEGHKVVVADLSGIELRVNHFLWQEPDSMARFQADAKADLYKAFAAKLYNKAEAEVTKDERQIAKISQLSLGYGVGWRKFRDVARLMGGVDLTEDQAKDITYAWRSTYNQITDGWKSCGTALEVIHGGRQMYEIDPWGMCVATKQGIKTPRGAIRYPGLHSERDDKGKEEWWYGSGRSRARIYGAKCLAEGTQVLTDSGWKPIEMVKLSDKVHDGVEFVNHGGKLFNGVQECVRLDGVNMTPNHGVLTDDGWQEASQFPRLYRPNLRGVDRRASAPHRWEEVALGVPMPVREHGDQNRNVSRAGGETWGYAKLRVHDARTDLGGEHGARDVQAPGIRGVEGDDRSVSATHTPSLEKLRRAWDCGVSAVAGVVRELLGGHGADVPAWAYAGSDGQRGGLLARKLPLGSIQRPDHEPAEIGARSGHTKIVRGVGGGEEHALLSGQARSPVGRPGRQTEIHPVWDIMNSGPLNRFVVLGDEGPFVVHNCTENLVQHLSRHVMTDAMLAYMKDPIAKHAPIVHTVHDEVITIAPDMLAQEALDILQDKLRTPPCWWGALVTYSDGDIAQTYGSAKS